MNHEQPTAPTLVVVGGVAAGASAATRARRINEHANIILFEKDEHVSFANCGLPYYIGGEIADRSKLLVTTAARLQQRFNIDVRTRQEVIAIDRQRQVVIVRQRNTGEQYEQAYDRLILAPGASPVLPPLAHVDASNVFTLRNLADADRIHGWVKLHGAKRAVIVGAGFIGLEMVEQLAQRNIAVTLVELQEQVLPLFDPEMTQPVADALAAHSVDLHLGCRVQSLETGSENLVTHVHLSDGEVIEAGLVLFGIGVRPNTKLAQEAGLVIGNSGGIASDAWTRTSDPHIFAVGDAAEYVYGPTLDSLRVPLAGPANRAGRLAGEMAASGKATAALAPVMGTAIVRVFDRVAAMTGLSLKQARRLNIPAQAVFVVGGHHAGYYPGAETLVLKLIYDPSDGRILGAQAVGQSGVDKRIDVIATAMAFNGTVRDLAGLDLAYAPPFGSAKDPVHMAGFAASNGLDELVAVVQPDADLAGKQVLDVRSDAEVRQQPIEGATDVVHIPIDDLRERWEELDPQRQTVTVCGSGVRSYAANRILQQHGFANLANLTGGQHVRTMALAAKRADRPTTNLAMETKP